LACQQPTTAKNRHSFIVAQRTERAKSGVTEKAVRRITNDGGVERLENLGPL